MRRPCRHWLFHAKKDICLFVEEIVIIKITIEEKKNRIIFICSFKIVLASVMSSSVHSREKTAGREKYIS